MRDLLDIRKFIFEASPQDKLVICTLTKKSGSSYRGVGAKKLVSLSGTSCGLLSGGCLEGSIEKAARERWHEMPFTESFSTVAEEDRLMGYQTGCKGVIEISFEQVPDRSESILEWKDKIEKLVPYDPIRLVVIGCGADAPPYVHLAREMGWDLCLIDYRKDFAKPEFFPNERVACLALKDIPAHIPEGKNVAVVLMTHNYEADLEILKGLRTHRLAYLACLGPAARYEKLKTDLWNFHEQKVSAELDAVVSAPAGIFTHSQSPSEIALSIVAEIQERLVERPKTSVWTLLLAAGASKRFGGVKALAEWQGETLLNRSLQMAAGFSGIRKTMVVTGGHAQVLMPYLDGVPHTHNENWSAGMGSSIASGVRAILDKDLKAEFILILPIDQPLIDKSHLEKLLLESRSTCRCALTSKGDVFGPPAVIPSTFFVKALHLEGDSGLKSLLNPSEMILVEGSQALQDLDQRKDFVDLHSYMESGL